MWWNYVIPIVTLIVGLVGGFFIGVYYLRRQLTSMQNDPQMLQKMAKQMGYNLNGKQMQQAQQMMKKNGGSMPGGMPGGKPPKGNAFPPGNKRRK
ncbi:YneF family protein [Saccharibacillus deserti]|uniref:YneF family protein n=1 Tax=Saccharibacillus deserti TaxID=1634444 RepID=UPI0015540027|nr:YneF family protein [Saccharibacillus deserti]